MTNKPVNKNAKEALNQMKLEIANELGIMNSGSDGSTNSAYQNGMLGGPVGGEMSKRLVEMGERELLRKYNSNK